MSTRGDALDPISPLRKKREQLHSFDVCFAALTHWCFSRCPAISPTQLTESMRVEYGRTIRNQFGQIASIDRARGRINSNIFGHKAWTVALDQKHEPNYCIIIGGPEMHACVSGWSYNLNEAPKCTTKCNEIACAYCEQSAENKHRHVLSPNYFTVVLPRHCLKHCVGCWSNCSADSLLLSFISICSNNDVSAFFFHISLDLFSA